METNKGVDARAQTINSKNPICEILRSHTSSAGIALQIEQSRKSSKCCHLAAHFLWRTQFIQLYESKQAGRKKPTKSKKSQQAQQTKQEQKSVEMAGSREFWQ